MKQCEMSIACDAIKKIDCLEDMGIIRRQFNLTMKSLKAQKALESKAKFSVGDKIIVNSKKGSLSGTITKLNRTRAICDINGSSYNVPFSIMEAA